ncbi:hypothetical protein [Rhizobium laguerreae]|uniref:hypothetical protein n=1 Tax=Rhizobium laguerreae TaxID=1076926 RepID=UPI001C918507|nr:hypothetical protein [Rhizobium laguerreae]MBY3434839.1 hypothetical protein [Rhizobium laguerreae]MBY3448982.1 hypothetical protein [Rhizobium laguerreae]MBY3456756.1 hypothetical protein [Rhizobium laguerreae]
MEETTKKCSKCGETKTLAEFHKSTKERLGVRNTCKKCNSLQVAEWRADNPGRHAETTRLRRQSDPAKARADREKYRASKESERQRAKIYREENRDKYRDSAKKSQAKIRATEKGKLNSNFSRSIKRGLVDGKATVSSFSLVDYTIDDLRKHLEAKFTEGMSWSNYGRWHIDHIIPLAAFNYEKFTDHDFKRAWALSNLQPLWARDNFSKRDRLASEFQPSLLF